jgi:hypothetical protein
MSDEPKQADGSQSNERPTIGPNAILRLVIGLVGISSLAAVVFLAGIHKPEIRGPFGSVGFLAAATGTGVAIWFAIRSRRWPLAAAAIVSLALLVFWLLAMIAGMYARPAW